MNNFIRVAENRDTHDVICGYTVYFPSDCQPILMLVSVNMEFVKYGRKFGRVIRAAIYFYPIAVCSQILLVKEYVGILFFPIELVQKNLIRLALFLAKS